jgi:hypothetical protein
MRSQRRTRPILALALVLTVLGAVACTPNGGGATNPPAGTSTAPGGASTAPGGASQSAPAANPSPSAAASGAY